MTASFAVVTVTYSSGDYLHNFLRTLTTASSQTPQVVIADNGSTDGAPEKAAADYANVTLVDTGGNIGYGGAVNRGVAELDPGVEFIIVANPDVSGRQGLSTNSSTRPGVGRVRPASAH